VTEDDIAFMIGPRINTASRMDHATASFTLLTTQSGGEASWISARLEALNIDRKTMVEKILNGIEEKILAYGIKIPEVIVCGDFNWHPGVLGIAANRLIDKYGRPIFLWGKAEAKEIKGSCRSDGSINLVELMQKMPTDFFIDFGGHALAGGFSLVEEKMSDLEKEILKAWKKISKEKTENNTIFIDKEISIDDISWDFYSLIEKFQPFGIENPKPVFLFLGAEVARVKKFGNNGIHIQADFKKSPPAGGDEFVPAIGFFFNGSLADVKEGSRIDLAASLEKSFFRPKPELRLRIIDIKLKS
jgi:single-stranded-DNA-specific exonuclease